MGSVEVGWQRHWCRRRRQELVAKLGGLGSGGWELGWEGGLEAGGNAWVKLKKRKNNKNNNNLDDMAL